jgi:hypothetical protein
VRTPWPSASLPGGCNDHDEAFDQLDGVVEAMLVRDMASQQANSDRTRVVARSIDKLIQVASELTEALAARKQPRSENR